MSNNIDVNATRKSDADDIKNRVEFDAADLPFKKSLHGYNIQDVNDYLATRANESESTRQMYAGKVEELKSELAFLGRERDSLMDKLDICQKELAIEKEHTTPETVEIQVPSDANSAELEEKISTLTASNQKLITELAQLRQEHVEAGTVISRLNDQLSDFDEVKGRCDDYYERIRAMTAEAEKKDAKINSLLAVQREYNDFKEDFAELEEAKLSVDKKNAGLTEELEKRAELLQKASNTNEQLRHDISEFEIRQSVLRQQLKKADAEVAEVREQKKKQAYDYASKTSDMETDFTQSKLAMQKQMQVHLYHIKQIDLLLDELKTEFKDAKLALASYEESQE